MRYLTCPRLAPYCKGIEQLLLSQLNLIVGINVGLEEEGVNNGVPEWIRTTDLPLRRRLLYPAELPRPN